MPSTPPLSLAAYSQRIANARKTLNETIKKNKCPKSSVDKFTVGKCLTSGKLAEIWMATEKSSEKEVAFKVIKKEKCKESHDNVSGTLQAKRLMDGFDSPFFVELLYAWQDSLNLYFVMERAQFGDLSLLIKKREAVPEEEVQNIACQLIMALEYLHSCGIMHRDLTPRHILIFEPGFLKITDLTTAKSASTAQDAISHGKYTAPEMWKNKEYGNAVDWWSVGAILYDLHYARHPFTDSDLEVRIKKDILDEELKFPNEKDKKSEKVKFLTALLEKKGAKRLGVNGADEVKDHPWFVHVKFMDIYNRKKPLGLKFDPVKESSEATNEFKAGVESKDHGEFDGF